MGNCPLGRDKRLEDYKSNAGNTPFGARKLRKVATQAEVLRLYLRGTTPSFTKNTFIGNLTL